MRRPSTTRFHDATSPIACAACDLNSICRVMGLIPPESPGPRLSSGMHRSIRAGAMLYQAGLPASALFAIRRGTVKLVSATSEGGRRIVSFHVPGEVLGLEAFGRGTYVCDAIVLEPAQYCELPLALLGDRSSRAGSLATELIKLLSLATAPRRDLARGKARERVVNFLLDLSQRLASRGLEATELKLSMSRLEVADLLDMRIEAVSRALQDLNREQ